MSVIALALCAHSAGCTIIGVAVGSWRPKYTTAKAPQAIPVGREVRVEGVDARGRARSIEGTKLGPSEPDVLCVLREGEQAPRCGPLAQVRRVRYRDGDYGTTGLIVGLLLDVTFVAMMAMMLDRTRRPVSAWRDTTAPHGPPPASPPR